MASVLQLLNNRKQRIGVAAASEDASQESATPSPSLKKKVKMEDVIALSDDDDESKGKPEEEKKLANAKATTGRKAKPAASKIVVGALDGFFKKAEAKRRSEDEGENTDPARLPEVEQQQDPVISEVHEDPDNSDENAVIVVNDGSPTKASSTLGTPEVLPMPTPAPAPMASAVAIPKAPTKAPKQPKQLAHDQLEILKSHVRLAGTKSKDAMIKELREALPTCSQNQIALQLVELAVKHKWSGSTAKTWRLKEEVPDAELAEAIAAQTEKKETSAAKAKEAKMRASPIEADPAKALQESITAEPTVLPSAQPVTSAAPVPLPSVDPKYAELIEKAETLLTETKALFKEMFESLEPRNASLLPQLAAAIPLESFEQKQPSDEASKLIGVIVSDSRRCSKADLSSSVASALAAVHGGVKPADAILEGWIDLLAKKVEYFEDFWGFEMEKNSDKHGKSRRAGMRSTFALYKALGKLQRDLQVAKLPVEKLENAHKECAEKLAKVQREWFNREEKRSTTPVAMSSAAEAKPTTSKAKKSSSSAITEPSAASVSTQAPKAGMLSMFGFTSKKKVEESLTSPKSDQNKPLAFDAVATTTTSSVALLKKFNEPDTAKKPKVVTSEDSVVVVHDVSSSASTDEVQVISSSNEDSVIALDDQPISSSSPSKRQKQVRNVRKAVLYVDSRIRIRQFTRGKDHSQYFKAVEVSGRRPFGKSSLLDYEIDSEDEDGEDLSDADLKADEEEEDPGLDYKDGWLEHDEVLAPMPVSTVDSTAEAQKLVPCVVGVFFGATSSYNQPALSIRNQPFEIRTEHADPTSFLAKFTIVVRKRTLEESQATDIAGTSAAANTATTSTNASNAKTPTGIQSDIKKPVKALPVNQLRMFVELVEGSGATKNNLVNEISEKLKLQFAKEAPSKATIQSKLAEIAERIGKQWLVKDEVRRAVGMDARRIEVSLSIFDKASVLEMLKSQGVQDPTEEQIYEAEVEFYKKKMSTQAPATKKKSKAKANAPKATPSTSSGISSIFLAPSAVPPTSSTSALLTAPNTATTSTVPDPVPTDSV